MFCSYRTKDCPWAWSEAQGGAVA